MEIEDGDLIGTRANGSGAGVSGGIEPDEGVGKDGAKRFEERNGDAIRVIEFVLDGAWIAGFFRGFASGEEHEQSGSGGEEGRDTKEPAPFSCRNGQGKETESSENEGSEKADGDLAELNHEAKDSRKSSAFLAGEPSGVNFDHPRATEGLEVAVEEPDHRKGGEGSSEGTEAKDQINGDGADSADEEGFAAADAVGEESIDQLARTISEGPDGEHVGDLRGSEVELGDHTRGRETEIVAAHVVGAVKATNGDPV